MKIFKLTTTFACYPIRYNGCEKLQSEINFDSIDKVIDFIKEKLFPDFDNVPIIDAPILNGIPTAEYWNIESKAIKEKKSFRMPLPDNNEYQCTRYIIYYHGESDTTYLVEVSELL